MPVRVSNGQLTATVRRPTGVDMQTERITVRLPTQDIRAVDLLIKVGEFVSRSDAMRVAVKELVDSRLEEAIEKADRRQKVQKLAAKLEEIDEYSKK